MEYHNGNRKTVAKARLQLASIDLGEQDHDLFAARQFSALQIHFGLATDDTFEQENGVRAHGVPGRFDRMLVHWMKREGSKALTPSSCPGQYSFNMQTFANESVGRAAPSISSLKDYEARHSDARAAARPTRQRGALCTILRKRSSVIRRKGDRQVRPCCPRATGRERRDHRRRMVIMLAQQLGSLRSSAVNRARHRVSPSLFQRRDRRQFFRHRHQNADLPATTGAIDAHPHLKRRKSQTCGGR